MFIIISTIIATDEASAASASRRSLSARFLSGARYVYRYIGI